MPYAPFTDAALEAYLDEALPVVQMTAVEEALRRDDTLQQRLAAINGRRDAGLHTLGEIWRRHRLSCPSREELGSFLLGVLSDDAADYITFHIETLECRFCAASLDDLRAQQSAADAATTHRRERYFQSSRHYLSSK